MNHKTSLIIISSILLIVPLRTRADIGISTIASLSFGRIASATGGTVTISPAGARSKSGGVVLVSSDAGSAARFQATGNPGQIYTITLPADNAVQMTSGIHSMGVSYFISSLGSSGVLNPTGNQVFSIGATLNINTGEASGSYSGTYSIIIDYQ